MGLLESIFFRNWPRPLENAGPPDLTLDLARGALGVFSLNTPTETLKERLGPPANWNRWRRYGQWHYPDLGLWFETSEGLIDGFNVVTREGNLWTWFGDWQKFWQPWRGAIRFPDGFKVSALEVEVEDFLTHAGKPAERDDDEEEIVLEYRYPDAHQDHGPAGYDTEFTSGGEFKSLSIW